MLMIIIKNEIDGNTGKPEKITIGGTLGHRISGNFLLIKMSYNNNMTNKKQERSVKIIPLSEISEYTEVVPLPEYPCQRS